MAARLQEGVCCRSFEAVHIHTDLQEAGGTRGLVTLHVDVSSSEPSEQSGRPPLQGRRLRAA